MAYRLIVTAPTKVTVGGKTYQFTNEHVGESLLLPDNEARAILGSEAGGNFRLVSSAAQGTPLTIHKRNISPVVKPKVNVPKLTKHAEWATPYAPGTVADPNSQYSAPVVEEVEAPEPKVEAKSVEETTATAITEPEPVELIAGLDPKAHWSKVRSRVLELEDESPIDYDAIRAIKEGFSTMQAVVRECDRVLEFEATEPTAE
jgi:hypothetical protein